MSQTPRMFNALRQFVVSKRCVRTSPPVWGQGWGICPKGYPCIFLIWRFQRSGCGHCLLALKLQTPPLTPCGQAQDLTLQGRGCCTPSEHPGGGHGLLAQVVHQISTAPRIILAESQTQELPNKSQPMKIGWYVFFSPYIIVVTMFLLILHN